MSLFTPNITSTTTFVDRGRFLLAWRMSLSFSIIFIGLTIFYGITNAEALLPMAIAGIITSSCVVYLKLTKNFKPLFWVFAITGTVVTNFALNYVMDFTHYVDFIWIIVSVLVAFIGLGFRYGILFFVLNSIGIAYFFWYTLNTHIETLIPKTNNQLIGDYIEILLSFFVIIYLIRQFIVFQQHSEKELIKLNRDLEEQNKLILSKNSENETLLKEIHHRVKNNLQIIISLLRMQSGEMRSEESKKHFTEAINRIMAMSLIHQKLYGSKELSKIDIESYINELVTDIISVSLGKNDVSLKVNAKVNDLSIDTIVPLGLLVNELVSNSLKHAFNEENGEISIEINQVGEKLDFSYSDNGSWKEPVKDRISFGVELIDILTEQMNGSKMLNVENGTHYTFKLMNI